MDLCHSGSIPLSIPISHWEIDAFQCESDEIMLSALALERVKETSEAIRCQREREKRTYLGVIDPQLAFLELLCHVALSSILELSQHLLKPECFIFLSLCF